MLLLSMKISLITLLFVLGPVFRLCKEVESKSSKHRNHVPPLSSARHDQKQSEGREERLRQHPSKMEPGKKSISNTLSVRHSIAKRKVNEPFHQMISLNGNDTTPLILWVHYHKTGHALTHQLGWILKRKHRFELFLSREREMSFFFWDSYNPKVKELIRSYQTHNFANESVTCPHLDDLYRDHINPNKLQLLALEAPDFFCDGWSDSMPRSFKLVHFVRDPFDMCLSSYLYHSQDPTPEEWVKSPRLHPCNHSREFLASVAAKIDMTMDDLDPVIKLCMSLYPSNSTHYYEGLTSLSTFDGLRLETSRFIISRDGSAGGDILRMAANAIEFAKVKNRSRVTSVYLQNFTSPDTNVGQTSVERLLEFSFQKSDSWTVSIAGSYFRMYRAKVDKGHRHVTKAHISYEERMRLISKLEYDEVLGPVLKQVQAQLNSYT